MGTGFRLFHIGLNKKIQAKLLFMALKTYIFEMKLRKPRPRDEMFSFNQTLR